MHHLNRSNWVSLLLILVGIWVFPLDAFAWGPVAHLDYASQILAGIAAVAPATMTLLKKHPYDFLYGALAADSIVGKNLAAIHDHCHSWKVARELYKNSRKEGDHREAMMLGFISHLGADVVAHNHIIPKLLVIHFRARGVGHLYWEARADQKLLNENPELKEQWLELSGMKFPGHDQFLADNIVPTLLTNNLSAKIYKRSLSIQKGSPWQIALRRIEENSKLVFPQKEVLLWRDLAAEMARQAVENPWSARLDFLDPTGMDALTAAQKRRKLLRRQLKLLGEGPALEEIFHHTVLDTQTIDIKMFDFEGDSGEGWAQTL